MDSSHNKIETIWESVKDTIKNEYEITDISYDTWLKPLSYYKEDSDSVTIMIPKEKSHALAYIKKNFNDYFQVTISEMMNHTYSVSFITENEVDETDKSDTNEIVINKNLYDQANLNYRYNFDNFVVGSNNILAQSACLAVAESPGENFNPLFIYGGPGLGKTHLMYSIGNYIVKNNPDIKVLYVTSESFLNEVIESIRSGNASDMTKLREKYRMVDVLLIDDIQFIIGKESTQEEFFHTFNALHSAGKAIVISSDRHPKQMETLDDRFRSRFEWGLIADIQPPNYETRVAILKNKNNNNLKKVNNDIIEYIATNIKSNIRELEGALNKIIYYSNIDKSEITIEFAEKTLKDMIDPNKPQIITPTIILEVVAEHYGISPSVIASKKRSSDVVQPRHIVMYLCREMTDNSLSNIAKLLDKKDHTTIMSGARNIELQIKTDPELAANIEAIKKKILPS